MRVWVENKIFALYYSFSESLKGAEGEHLHGNCLSISEDEGYHRFRNKGLLNAGSLQTFKIAHIT